MKIINKSIYLLMLCGLYFLSACELDNYEPPTAGLHGAFIDSETGELVEQDIIRGTVIEIREHGYDPVAPQYLNAKVDGTFANTMLFPNMYTVQPVRGNFVPIEPQEVEISGNTELNFTVTPYISLKDVEIVKSGSKVTATFKLEQNIINNVRSIGLFAHSDPRVGEPVYLLAKQQNLFYVVDPNREFTLELNVGTLEPGKPHFFRVGALIEAPEAKFNYAPAVRINL